MLKEHMRVHDNIREYLCAECGKGMSNALFSINCDTEYQVNIWIKTTFLDLECWEDPWSAVDSAVLQGRNSINQDPYE